MSKKKRKRTPPLLTVRKTTRDGRSYRLPPDSSITIDFGDTNTIVVINRGAGAVYLRR